VCNYNFFFNSSKGIKRGVRTFDWHFLSF
jgi:hypothetical protein